MEDGIRRRAPGRPAARGGHRLLTYAAALYGIGLVAHTADHIRRGSGVLTPEVYWAGIVSTMIGVATIALVLGRHRVAPLAAALAGGPIAVGVAMVHLLPRWSVLSDAFPGAQGTGVTPLSWAVVLLEIAGALALGAAGVYVLRRQRIPGVGGGVGRDRELVGVTHEPVNR
jgi:hypothetical protein